MAPGDVRGAARGPRKNNIVRSRLWGEDRSERPEPGERNKGKRGNRGFDAERYEIFGRADQRHVRLHRGTHAPLCVCEAFDRCARYVCRCGIHHAIACHITWRSGGATLGSSCLCLCRCLPCRRGRGNLHPGRLVRPPQPAECRLDRRTDLRVRQLSRARARPEVQAIRDHFGEGWRGRRRKVRHLHAATSIDGADAWQRCEFSREHSARPPRRT